MSDRGDSPPRKRPSTTGDQNYPPRPTGGSRRPGGGRPQSPPNTGQRDSQRRTPRSSENELPYAKSTPRRDSEPTTDHYVIRSTSREPSRQNPSIQHRFASDSDRRPLQGRDTIQAAHTGPGRPPSAYHRQHQNQQAPLGRNEPSNPDPKVIYPNQQSFQSRRRSSVHQTTGESVYTANTSQLRSNEEAVSDDYARDFQTLNIRDQAQEERPRVSSVAQTNTHPISSQIPISSGTTAYSPNVRIALVHSTSGPLPPSQSSTGRITSAPPSVPRPSESTFRTSLPPSLVNFANVARNDWKTIETYIKQDKSLLKADLKPLLTEAIRAYSTGKDEYANQCIHRIALLQQLDGYSVKDCLEIINEIRNRKQPEAADFLKAYDKMKTQAKDGVRRLASSSSGTAATQQLSVAQSKTDAPSQDNPNYGSANQLSAIGPRYNSYETSGAQISAGTGASQGNMGTNASAEHNGHDRYTSSTGFSHLTSHDRYPLSSGFPIDRDRADRHVERQPEVQTTSVPTHLEPISQGPRILNPNPVPPSQDGLANISRISGQQPSLSSYQSNEADKRTESVAERDRRQSVSTVPSGNISIKGDNTFYPQSAQISQLDTRYKLHPHAFFKQGNVFAILWHEPGSPESPKGYTTAQQELTVGKYNELIYSTIRRMVVVKEGHGFCVCIQINSYGSRGLKKFRNIPREVHNHSIIHMSDTNPSYIDKDEPRTNKRAISVNKASSYQSLARESRLCYSQPHTVQHNVKAMHVGQVTATSLPWLIHYYKAAQE